MAEGQDGELSQKWYQVTKHYVEWTVKDFFSYRKLDDNCGSPAFTIQDEEWCLTLYPNGESDESSEGWIGYYIVLLDECATSMRANITFGIKNANGEVVNQKHGHTDEMFDLDGRYQGNPKFFARSELLERKAELAPDDVLTLTCSLVLDEKQDSSGTRFVKLAEDFADLLASKRGCDATLKVKNREFPVHKCIMSSRSTVFSAMFENDMKEKQTGIVDIEDCDPGAFQDFLLYIYSGKFDTDSDRVFELYRVGDKYDAQELKSSCVPYMISHLSAENACDAALLADDFNESELQERTQSFFNDNLVKILSTKKWMSFLKKNPRLANELLKKMASVKQT